MGVKTYCQNNMDALEVVIIVIVKRLGKRNIKTIDCNRAQPPPEFDDKD